MLEKILFLRYIGQNAHSQWDGSSFKSTISLEQIDETDSLIFCMLLQIHENEKFIENFLVGYGQKWEWLTFLKNLKLTIWKMNW